MKHNLVRVMVIVAVLFAFVGAVSADGRMNPSPDNNMGGDSMFCYKGKGCELLNKRGVSLGKWSQADIDAAIATSRETDSNVEVAPEGGIIASYGMSRLFIVFDGEGTFPGDLRYVENSLKLIGYDEYNKWVEFTFKIQGSGAYYNP